MTEVGSDHTKMAIYNRTKLQEYPTQASNNQNPSRFGSTQQSLANTTFSDGGNHLQPGNCVPGRERRDGVVVEEILAERDLAEASESADAWVDGGETVGGEVDLLQRGRDLHLAQIVQLVARQVEAQHRPLLLLRLHLRLRLTAGSRGLRIAGTLAGGHGGRGESADSSFSRSFWKKLRRGEDRRRGIYATGGFAGEEND